MTIKLLELFGGIGACTQALKRLGVDVDIVDYVEIDKYAVKSYNAINGTNFEPQDIKEWDDDSGLCPTINTMSGGNREPKIQESNTSQIRKLTPREIWRLMGFRDSEFDKAKDTNSDSQLYKQAGNSIVVNVLYYILQNLLEVAS